MKLIFYTNVSSNKLNSYLYIILGKTHDKQLFF